MSHPASPNITVETIVSAPIAKAWGDYTSPEAIVKWNAASEDWHTTSATADLRVGGEFCSRMEAKDGSMGFDFAGIYTEVREHERIAYTFGDRGASITFTETKEGVKVSVTFEAESEHPIEMQRDGWQAILDSFRKFSENN